jgi:hypothetical protein
MTYSEFQEQVNALKEILAERLQYSKNWQQVSLDIKKTFMKIKWYDNVEYFDPRGRILFKEVRIAPLNKDFIAEEIKRQRKKLKRDKKKWVDADGVG